MITNNLYVIAAICGNFWQESTVNPGIWEGLQVGAPGYGLGQWTDNPGVVMRRTALFDWLTANGYARDSGPGQLAFLIHENVWLGNGAGYQSAYTNLMDFLTTTSTNLSDLVYEFFHQWEGIDDGTGPVRLQFAQDVLPFLQNDPGSRDPWHSGNNYNSRQNAIMNSLLIMDFFLQSQPTPQPWNPTDEEIIAMASVLIRRRRNGGGGIIVF